MKKFITFIVSTIMLMMFVGCGETNSEASYYEEATVQKIAQKSKEQIYKEKKDSLKKYGVGIPTKIIVKEGGDKMEMTSEYSVKDLFIKCYTRASYYNSNIGDYQFLADDKTIILFNNIDEMKSVISGAIKMLNDGYANNVNREDADDFNIMADFSLRIDKSFKTTLYSINKGGIRGESVTVSLSELKSINKELKAYN